MHETSRTVRLCRAASAGLLLAALAASPGMAKEDPVINLSGKAGTLGLGMELGVDWNRYLSSRLGFNYLSFSGNIDVDDIEYDADPKWQNASLLVDFHPWQGMFRITGGILYNWNEVDVSATPTTAKTIGMIPYTPEQVGTIKGTASFNDWAPYLGIGWSTNRAARRGWGIGVDLGVMFQGAPSVEDLHATGTMADDPLFQYNLEKERQDIEDELDNFEYYPAISVMATYKF